ncbi:MAG: phosphoribosylformylglycinamidine cyclo-ligase [Micavibrio aeruginosavorus]|uniref:Phosphoribosylformylglycinamidine cyclo-ligase n=1 Tax=Micavibrio aeruginosavorus TaxID=349221 RepID=A0A7T5R1R7_9BACT|nr:MAG: phosphoribosylformylglycinamidine cyclo-ligase [Micavibrio aeruginosavorus]
MKDSAYKKAGVDIEAGDALVTKISPLAARTSRAGVMAGLGGFGALFDLKKEGFADPLLVSSTDGVGTKLKIAIETGLHDTVGIDLVAMSVNDLIVNGAKPLFFLDYFATGHLDVGVAARVIAGIAEGCRQAECALVGGETAEMPGMYQEGDYDLAGFAVGAVERARLIDGRRVKPGDIILGLASNGVHSNGYSLVRHVVDNSGLAYSAACTFAAGQTLGQALMTPTRIYVVPVQKAMAVLDDDGGSAIHAMAHITGSGLPGNAARTIPDNCALEIDCRSWALPPVFRWLRDQGGLSPSDLAETFNCGIGYIVIVSPEKAGVVMREFTNAGENVFNIGVVAAASEGRPPVRLLHCEQVWS